MTLSLLAAIVALALLQGALVALPRGDALLPLRQLRSPWWAFVLPGLIIVGTVGLALVPAGATDLMVLAAVATPPLAAFAAVAVVRRHLARFVLLTVAAGAVIALHEQGWASQLGASVVTAVSCLTVGTVIVRLVPTRWILGAIVGMCIVDCGLMALGLGQSSSHLLDAATLSFHGPIFDAAKLGTLVTEYPDLLLAAAMGAYWAGHRHQRRAAVLVFVFVTLYDLLLLVIKTVPATPPLVGAFLIVQLCNGGWRRVRLPRATRRHRVNVSPAPDLSPVSAPVAAVAGSCRARVTEPAFRSHGPAPRLEDLRGGRDHRRRRIRGSPVSTAEGVTAEPVPVSGRS